MRQDCDTCAHGRNTPDKCGPCGRTDRAADGSLLNWAPRAASPQQLQTALARQEGGGHYKDMKIQPVEFIHANGIPYMEGNAIKYLCRWRAKNGIEDLKKARHYIDLLIEMESKDAP